MKSFFHYSITVFSVSFLAVACAKKGSLQTDSTKTEAKYKAYYSFEDNGCQTGYHEFTSNDSPQEAHKKMCLALQDEDLNKNCAYEARKEHFEEKCDQAEWQSKPSSHKDFKKPKDGSSFLDQEMTFLPQEKMNIGGKKYKFIHLETTTENKKVVNFSFISCAANAQKALADKQVGLALLPQSTMAIMETKYNSNSNRHPPELIAKEMSCMGQFTGEDLDENFSLHRISAGERHIEAVTLLPRHSDHFGMSQMATISIYCIDRELSTTDVLKDTVTLFKGSRLLVKRAAFKDNSQNHVNNKSVYAVISCE